MTISSGYFRCTGNYILTQSAHYNFTIKVPKSMTKSSVRRSLRKVDLSGNELATIDDKFWLNTNLESVDLSNNKEPRGAALLLRRL